MYRYYIEILKHILATPWLEHAINWLPARRPTPLGHAHFLFAKLEYAMHEEDLGPSKVRKNL